MSEKMSDAARAQLEASPLHTPRLLEDVSLLPAWARIAISRVTLQGHTVEQAAKKANRAKATLANYLQSPAGKEWARALEEAGAQIVDSASEATAEFAILTDDTGQRVLSVSARNVPREYEVYYTVYYTATNGEQVLLAPQLQTLTRDYTWDETEVLGKSREEELMREAIVDDLVRTVLIQLSALEPLPASAAPPAGE